MTQLVSMRGDSSIEEALITSLLSFSSSLSSPSSSSTPFHHKILTTQTLVGTFRETNGDCISKMNGTNSWMMVIRGTVCTFERVLYPHSHSYPHSHECPKMNGTNSLITGIYETGSKLERFFWAQEHKIHLLDHQNLMTQTLGLWTTNCRMMNVWNESWNRQQS